MSPESLTEPVKMTVEYIPDPDGGYTARVPNISAYGEGKTKEKALLSLESAIRLYVQSVCEKKEISVTDLLSEMCSSDPELVEETSELKEETFDLMPRQ